MQLIYSRTETFRSSFFPASFRLWNELDHSVKNTDSLSSFKSKLKTKKHKYFYHDIGCRKISCILASIRMKCSKLKHDLSMNNIIDNNMCQCGNIETAYHFFFECPLYTIYRNDLQIETMFLHSLTLNIILNGGITLSAQRNIEIHSARRLKIYNEFKSFLNILNIPTRSIVMYLYQISMISCCVCKPCYVWICLEYSMYRLYL